MAGKRLWVFSHNIYTSETANTYYYLKYLNTLLTLKEIFLLRK